MLNLSAGFQRFFYNKSDADRLRKLVPYIDRALQRTAGNRELALQNLIALADGESALGDLIADCCAVAFAKWFAVMGEHLEDIN